MLRSCKPLGVLSTNNVVSKITREAARRTAWCLLQWKFGGPSAATSRVPHAATPALARALIWEGSAPPVARSLAADADAVSAKKSPARRLAPLPQRRRALRLGRGITPGKSMDLSGSVDPPAVGHSNEAGVRVICWRVLSESPGGR